MRTWAAYKLNSSDSNVGWFESYPHKWYCPIFISFYHDHSQISIAYGVKARWVLERLSLKKKKQKGNSNTKNFTAALDTTSKIGEIYAFKLVNMSSYQTRRSEIWKDGVPIEKISAYNLIQLERKLLYEKTNILSLFELFNHFWIVNLQNYIKQLWKNTSYVHKNWHCKIQIHKKRYVWLSTKLYLLNPLSK